MTELRADPCLDRMLETAPDETLATEVAGDRQAFAELYRRHVDGVYRYLRYQVPTQEAQDLTAQVFLKALRSSNQFRGDSAYRTWLFRIAHNTIVSHRRSRCRAPVPLPEVPDGADASVDPVTAHDRKESSRIVRRLLDDLSAQERELVELRFVEDLPPREIAAVTGHSPGAVRVRLHRLLRRLRARLEHGGTQP